MQNIIKSWFKYFIFVGFFGLCINLIYLAIPVYMMIVYDRVLFSFSRATLYTLSAGVVISLIMMGLIDYFRMRILGQAGNSLAQKMMPFVVKSMQKDAAGINQKGYGRGLYDLELLRNAIVQGHIFYILDLPWVLIYLGLLYIMHPLVGFVAIAGVLMVTLFQMLLKKLEKKRYTAVDVAFQANADFVGTCLQHARLVSGMGMLPAVMGKYKERYKKILASRSGADAFHSGAGSVIRLLHVAVLAAVFGAGAFVFFTDEITVGVIFASVIIIARLFYPFEQSLSSMKDSIDAMAAYKRLKHFVNTREQKNRLSLPVPEGKFDTEAVSLAVNGKTILHNISFALEPGQTLGIFGPSSAGKTSLCRVLLGIWPATAGKVRLDGAELAQWPMDELGKYVGYLPQEIELFPGTVAQNISRLQDVDSEKVIRAAKKAGVHEMILKLANGYDTKIDQTGKNLAAGQRQLISLARALYGDPKFVVLDEPHTHLDDLGLRMVFHTLKNLKHEKVTTIVVTDRPQLLVNMDKVLVIKEGQVAMVGPGKEVLGKLTNKQQPQQIAGV
ncbi:type I secretion system permease/ATPase [Desulfobacula sp.]|uniref:type I secretion system permease/ATPase n=1 Tax=Desulfobacula sp. TaxID=2593537 RepID=UPI0025BE9F05|nr:ATP-binding cassette domain-containing protein [Desulfobacula sp.]MBC2704937.1 ATP-binding cassette domain-containing protein [Desulfobacula sp.]